MRRDCFLEAKNWVFLALHLILISHLFSPTFAKLLFLVPYCLFIFLFSVEFKYFVLAWLLSLAMFFLRQFPFLEVKNTYFSHLNSFFDLNAYVCGVMDDLYPKDVSDFIQLFVLGKKGDIYYDFVGLGIVHLVSVSGFHVSFLIRLFRKLVNVRIIVFALIFVYWYALGFTIPALSPLLRLLFNSKNSYKSWSFSVVASLAFNVFIFDRISFLLSFMFPLLFAVNRDFFRDDFSRRFMDFWSAFVYASLVLLPMTNRLYAYAPINTLMFMGIIPVLFVYFFFFWPFSGMFKIHSFIFEWFSWFYKSLSVNRNFLEFDFWNAQLSLAILCALSLIFLLKKRLATNA